jgi:hypothetical protein
VKPEVRDTPPAGADVVIEPLASLPNVRRAADVLRLVLALAVLLVGLLVAILAEEGVRSTERGLLNTIVTLPPSLRDALTTVAQLVAVLMPAVFVLVMALRRRFAAVGKLVLAGAGAMLVGLLVSHLWLGSSHPPTWHELLAAMPLNYAAVISMVAGPL